MSETNVPEWAKERQFLRNASITIKNFKKENKIVIGNDFEIEFEYFKTIDQTKEDDSGMVTIYGLSDETIALLEDEGGEIWFDCGYEQSYIGTLFVAYISRVYTQISNNITATTIECSANMLTHFFSGYAVSDTTTAIPLVGLLRNIGISMGFGSVYVDFSNVQEQDKDTVVQFANYYKTNSYNIGDINTILEQVTDYYGLTYSRQLINDADSLVFTFTDLGIKKVLRLSERGYPALDVNDPKTKELSNVLYSTQEKDSSVNSGFVLTKDTGLIESQAEYQIATAFLDQKLNANEVETAESFYKRNNTVYDEPEADEDAEPKSNSYVDSGEAFVSNSALAGLVIKGGINGQATGGGKVRGYTADFAKIVSDVIGSDLIRFTGFNDNFHVGKSSNHNKGQAFDLTIKSGARGAPRQRTAILNAAEQHGFKVAVLDEYNKASEYATAGHLHVSVYGKNGTSPSNDEPSDNLDNIKKSNQEDYYGRTTIEINRRYNRILALLNPSIKPQSLIFTKDKTSDDYLVHRVRHATYKGNNKRGEWTMLLYCEDTETNRVSGAKVETTPLSTDLAKTTDL